MEWKRVKTLLLILLLVCDLGLGISLGAQYLTQRQRECFELRYYQDFSLGEIGQELGISRQGVYDNLTRTEALLKKMEDKTGCVRRDLQYRKTINAILLTISIFTKNEIITNENVSIRQIIAKISSEILPTIIFFIKRRQN